MEIFDLMTANQITQIVALIQNRVREFLNMKNQYADLFYENYSAHRNSYSVMYAILSAFTEKTTIDGIVVNEINYGANNDFCQPELHSNNVILHIYNNKNKLNSTLIKNMCKEYNGDFERKPIYACILVKTNRKSQLKEIKLVVPNYNGEIIETFIIYKEKAILKIA